MMQIDIAVIEDINEELMKIDSAIFQKTTELRAIEDQIFALRQKISGLMVDGWQRDAGLPIHDNEIVFWDIWQT